MYKVNTAIRESKNIMIYTLNSNPIAFNLSSAFKFLYLNKILSEITIYVNRNPNTK